MRAIVTCGSSYEPIDEVRRITNFSTGALGVMLSNALASERHDVLCMKGEGASPGVRLETARIARFSTNDDLLGKLRTVEDREGVGALFHAAALADFKVRHANDDKRKISSRTGEVTLTLMPATKIIAELRPLFPNAKIVGWKYELDGTRDEVMAKAARQISENRTDMCVANGAAYGVGFGALEKNGGFTDLPDKAALCAWLVRWLAS